MKMSEHYTTAYYNPNGSRVKRSKRKYETELEAQHVCFFLNLKPETIHKHVCYKCSVCGKWHIGHHFGKELTQEDKEKIRKQYGKWRTVHNIK